MPRLARLRFRARNESVGAARRFAVDTTAEWGLAELRDDVELLVSELVSNAVRHTGRDGTLELTEIDAGVRVEVSDSSREVPTVGRAAPGDESGRGMRLVEQLASAWGVVRRRHGKSVWFELSTRSPAAA